MTRYTPPGWALMKFGEIRQQVESDRPARVLPTYVYHDATGRADPWMQSAGTMMLPVIVRR